MQYLGPACRYSDNIKGGVYNGNLWSMSAVRCRLRVKSLQFNFTKLSTDITVVGQTFVALNVSINKPNWAIQLRFKRSAATRKPLRLLIGSETIGLDRYHSSTD